MYAIKPQCASFMSFSKQLKEKFPTVLFSNPYGITFVWQTPEFRSHM
jgi:hypothetical protein